MPPDHDDRPVRPFADLLRELSGGRTHEELSEGIRDLTEAIRATGKGGSITFTLSLKPLDKGNADALLITDKVTVKAPQLERKATVFFPDADANLRRTDPNQLTFDGPLRDASSPPPRVLDHAERAAGDLR